MNNSVEITEALQYKLLKLGFRIDGSTNISCDNGVVYVNTTQPELTLSKNHHHIAYHRAQEMVAIGTVRVSKENLLTNFAYLLTNTIAAPNKEGLLDKFTY